MLPTKFFPICLQTWPPQAILVSDWLISKKIVSSETTWPNESKLKSTNQKQEWPVVAMFINEWDLNAQSL
jgi:hypothetical protein